MKPAIEIISERISRAIDKATGLKNSAAIVTPATDSKFGDYQSNGAFAVAKQLKVNPRQLAEQVVAALQIDDICLPPEIAGAGFINLRLKPEFVIKNLLNIDSDENLGIEKAQKPQTVVVDFSGPNIAKQMHVGHLRSTILGDCICRMLELAGHTVIRQNHIGDWGLQIAMVVQAVRTECLNLTYNDQYLTSLLSTPQKWEDESLKRLNLNLEQLESLYIKANKALATGHPTFEKDMRSILFGLQHGEIGCLNSWSKARDITLKECQYIYDTIQVTLTEKDVRGESFYKNFLVDIVDELRQKKDSQGNPIAELSDGAICVFPDKEKFKTKEGEPLPFIIQKSDGAFLYATTDLAALRYRVNELKADRIVYVTDARQKLHFEMLFAVAKMAGWVNDNIKLDHITFGSVLGEDGKPLKTRSGENVKLKELLDEAVKRAKAVVEEKNPELSDGEKEKIANAVGIGAVKYADYSNNRTSDYIFSFDKMLAMEGNTAPYMQYAYARIQSISRKAQEKGIDAEKELKNIKELNLAESAEFELAKHLIRYSEAFNSATTDFKPNFLTSYLYELAQKFSTFYNACPVLDAPGEIRPTRLLLCKITSQVIRHGLKNLLGIETIERM